MKAMLKIAGRRHSSGPLRRLRRADYPKYEEKDEEAD
jgi:hypothetical protein